MIVAAVLCFPHNNHVLKVEIVFYLLLACMLPFFRPNVQFCRIAETHSWSRNGKDLYLLNEISIYEKRCQFNLLTVSVAVSLCVFSGI
jgi:hypothetical protein